LIVPFRESRFVLRHSRRVQNASGNRIAGARTQVFDAWVLGRLPGRGYASILRLARNGFVPAITICGTRSQCIATRTFHAISDQPLSKYCAYSQSSLVTCLFCHSHRFSMCASVRPIVPVVVAVSLQHRSACPGGSQSPRQRRSLRCESACTSSREGR
jgi:hypothetical protein